MIQYFPIVTGSLTVLGNINVSGSITTSGSITISGSITSASFASTASYWSGSIVNAESASFVANAQTASYVLNAVSSSFASTASFVALAQSASNAVSAVTASFANNLTVAGTLTAQTLVVQTITSSVDFVTGSTRFGSLSSNTHVFTGSMYVTGALYVTTGSVGIGTTAPNYTLHIDSNTTLTRFQITNSTTGQGGGVGLQVIQNGLDASITNRSNGYLGFETVGTERMRITSGGITIYNHTSSVGTAFSPPVQVKNNASAIGNGYGIISANTEMAGGIGLSSSSTNGITITADPDNLRASSDITFNVDGTQRMTITSGGDVLMGYGNVGNLLIRQTTNGTVDNNSQSIGNNGINYMNRVSGTGLYHIFFNNGNNIVGSITSNTTNTQFNTSSDYRLKKDLKDFNALNVLSNIKLYDFAWKLNDSRMYGVMAHELKEILPYAVVGEKDELDENNNIKSQGVDYSLLTPVLAKALQELNTKFEEYKATHP